MLAFNDTTFGLSGTFTYIFDEKHKIHISAKSIRTINIEFQDVMYSYTYMSANHRDAELLDMFNDKKHLFAFIGDKMKGLAKKLKKVVPILCLLM